MAPKPTTDPAMRQPRPSAADCASYRSAERKRDWRATCRRVDVWRDADKPNGPNCDRFKPHR